MNNRAMNHGKRNLILLGGGAMLITIVMTTMSLWIYRSSGDIYLDRSRPGYLPDKEEAEEETNVDANFVYSDTGTLDAEELGEYLEELKSLDDRLKALAEPYASGPLLDASLGIPSSSEKDAAEEK